MSIEDFEELIGGPPLKRRPGRPRKGEVRPPTPEEVEAARTADDWQTYRKPVTIDFLANVFRVSRATVKQRLGDCPEVERGRYDFLEAASRVVVPRFSTEEYVKVLSQKDLPPTLQLAFWSGMRAKQQWAEDAGDLWRTERVVEVFGEAFKLMKTTLQLFADSVDQEHTLTIEQRKTIGHLVDGLQRDMHAQLVGLAKERQTPSQITEAPE